MKTGEQAHTHAHCHAADPVNLVLTPAKWPNSETPPSFLNANPAVFLLDRLEPVPLLLYRPLIF